MNNHFYFVSYLIIQDGVLKGGNNYLRASETPLHLGQLKEYVKERRRKDLSGNIEIVILNIQKISEEDYNSFLPGEMPPNEE